MTTPECWTPGDVVLDAVGGLWVRAHEDSTAQGWPWAYADGSAPRPDPATPDGPVVAVPEGTVAEGGPVRPLVLLVRRGRPVMAGTGAAADGEREARIDRLVASALDEAAEQIEQIAWREGRRR